MDSDNILKLYANAPAGFTIPAGAEVFLRFKSNNPDHTVYTRYQQFDSSLLPVPGKFNYVKLNCKDIDKFAGAGNDGESTDPYLIADKYQLMEMRNLVVAAATTCFKMVDDVDLAGESWIPFNYASPYDKAVDFDGNGHKILNLTSDYSAYPSFAGVVAGDIQHVTFVNPVITGGTQHAEVSLGGAKTAMLGPSLGVDLDDEMVVQHGLDEVTHQGVIPWLMVDAVTILTGVVPNLVEVSNYVKSALFDHACHLTEEGAHHPLDVAIEVLTHLLAETLVTPINVDITARVGQRRDEMHRTDAVVEWQRLEVGVARPEAVNVVNLHAGQEGDAGAIDPPQTVDLGQKLRHGLTCHVACRRHRRGAVRREAIVCESRINGMDDKLLHVGMPVAELSVSMQIISVRGLDNRWNVYHVMWSE